MYIPSTQKLAFNKKLKQAKDSSLLDAVEHDENKLDEIENDIFTKITESVDKIFKLPSLDARSTFSGYKMLTPDLDLTKDRPRTQTINEGTRERRHSIEERFQEIAEADEEEEKETRKGTIRGNPDRSTTFFFNGESSKSDSGDDGDSSRTDEKPDSSAGDRKDSDAQEPADTNVIKKIQEYKMQELQLMDEINVLAKEVEEEEKEEAEGEGLDDEDSELDSQALDSHFDNEATEEDRKEDLELQEELFAREKEVDFIDNALTQKQELLNAIIESNKEMKKNIVDTMKQEYLKKIIALQNEIKKLESQKDRDIARAKTDASKSSVDTEYKKKIKDLEKELKVLKKKDQEQVDKLRTSKKQKEKIKLLSEEIDSMKTQKVQLMRQIKEDKEKYRKWKDAKTKAMMKMKRENQKKDEQISKLKRENNLKNNVLRRKVEELKALQKRQKEEVKKHRKALAQKRSSRKIDPEKIKKWVKENTQKLMRYQDVKEEMEKEQKLRKDTEKEIEEEQHNFAVVQTKKEKLESQRNLIDSEDYDALEDVDQEIRAYELELNNINENMNSLEDKLDFINEKISVFKKEVIEINPEGIESLRFEEITNLEEAKIYLGSFFNIFLEMNVYRNMVENKILEQEDTIEKYKEEIEILNNKLQASEVKFREEINKMAEKYKQKQDQIKAEINEFMKLDLLNGISKDQDYEQVLSSSPIRLMKEKSLSDLNGKSSKQLRDEIKQRKQALREVARVQATSKIGLSKLVTSLEKQTKEDEKKIEILNHKLNQAAQEKQMFKQKYETLKAQVKSNETDDIKLIKTISLETREKYNKSPYGRTKSRPEPEKPPLKSLQQARRERKKVPGFDSKGDMSGLDLDESDSYTNRTPQRVPKLFQKHSLDVPRVKDFNRNSFVSGHIYTTNAPMKTQPSNAVNKTTPTLGGLVNDEADND